jgi:hypothetical protein
MRRSLVIITAICTLAAESDCALGDEIEVRLIPSATQIRMGETLRLRAEFRNATAAEVRFDAAISTTLGTLEFEARHESQPGFSKVYAVDETPCPGHWEVKRSNGLRPSEFRVEHNAIGWFKETPVLNKEGQWLIRARIKDNDGVSGVSDPILVTIQPAADAELTTLRERSDVLLKIGRARISRFLKTQDVDQLLGKTRMAQIVRDLEIARLCLGLRETRDPEEFAELVKRLNGMLKDEDPVSRESYSLIAASELIELKRLDFAQHYLNQLPYESYDRIRLESVIRKLKTRKQPAPAQ